MRRDTGHRGWVAVYEWLDYSIVNAVVLTMLTRAPEEVQHQGQMEQHDLDTALIHLFPSLSEEKNAFLPLPISKT